MKLAEAKSWREFFHYEFWMLMYGLTVLVFVWAI